MASERTSLLFQNRPPARGAILLLFFSLALLVPGTLSRAAGPPKLKAVATLFPLQEFARAVGGERVQVDLILPLGAEPHVWEPKPSDLAKIHRADLFIYVGRAMEPWADDLLKAIRGEGLKVVEAGKGLDLPHAGGPQGQSSPKDKPHGGEKADPHVWLDFSLSLQIVDALAAAFSQKDPGQASRYQARASAYKSKLEDLDRKFKEGLSRCRHRNVILGGHSAFSYLARRYGLKQTPLYGISPDAEPTPRKLAEVVNAARHQEVKYLFFEELVNPKLANVLAAEAGIQTLVLHDGANLTREQAREGLTFLDLMERNLTNLRKGLECEP